MTYVQMNIMHLNNLASKKSDIKNWKLGISSGGINHLTLEKYINMKTASIDAVELSYNFEKDEGFDIFKQKEYADNADILLWSFHLPWHHQQCNIAHLDSNMRKIAVDIDKEMIKKCSAVGIKYGVIHPSGEPIDKKDRPQAMINAQQSLYELSKTAEKENFVIAVENLPRTCLGNCSSDINELLTVSESLKVCFDVNHLLTESHSDFIKRAGKKIATLHISDYDFINERHWMPGEGKINWTELINLLEGIGYEGAFIYELNLKPEKTIKRRDLTYSDFKDNFNELSRKMKPAALGVPDIPV
ncbi:MAG: sugar phosphate isomerase/epimerase family protein [Clostridia bacterium]